MREAETGTMADDLIKDVQSQLRGMRKGNIDVFPQQFTLQCGSFEVRSDGKSQHTHVFINGKEAKGIYSLKLNLNTQRQTKIELGVFLDDFTFDLHPRGKNG
jgi:hypothetical protein